MAPSPAESLARRLPVLRQSPPQPRAQEEARRERPADELREAIAREQAALYERRLRQAIEEKDAAQRDELERARRLWQEQLQAECLAVLRRGLAEIERRIGEDLGEALRPIVRAAIMDKAVDVCAARLKDLVSGRGTTKARVRGPAPLVEALRSAFEHQGVEACVEPGDGADLRIEIDDACIRFLHESVVETLERS